MKPQRSCPRSIPFTVLLPIPEFGKNSASAGARVEGGKARCSARSHSLPNSVFWEDSALRMIAKLLISLARHGR
jgi:hypothetical protein